MSYVSVIMLYWDRIIHKRRMEAEFERVLTNIKRTTKSGSGGQLSDFSSYPPRNVWPIGLLPSGHQYYVYALQTGDDETTTAIVPYYGKSSLTANQSSGHVGTVSSIDRLRPWKNDQQYVSLVS